MSHASRRRDRERLERELQSGEYGELLRGLRESHPFYRRFGDWSEVLSFMHAGEATEEEKDRVLRPIFQAHAPDRDARWRTVLLAIFWPGLESVFWQKRHWDPDPDRRWQNVSWAFLQSICGLDPAQRPAGLPAKVINDTVNRLYREYRSEWDRGELEHAAEHDEIVALAGQVEALGIAAVDLRDSLEACLARLRGHVERGRISETDYLMLVATRIYDETLAEWSREHDVDYELAKKRRQRAEARIRRIDGKPGEFGI